MDQKLIEANLAVIADILHQLALPGIRLNWEPNGPLKFTSG